MLFLAIITGIAILFLIVQCIQWGDECNSYGFGIFCGLCLATAFSIEIVCISETVSKPHPTAMDVYQGKTTLEYTIIDGIKVDSVVVFKKK